MAQIIDDVRLMTQDTFMASSLSSTGRTPAARFLQPVVYQRLKPLIAKLAYSILPMLAIRKMKRCGKRACMLKISNGRFNQYIQTRDLNKLTVNDELIATIQVFWGIGFNTSQRLLVEQRFII